MKSLNLYICILGISVSTVFSCEKNYAKKCYDVKIIKISCGGTVVQFLSEEQIGETWKDASGNSAIYQNSVLAGNIPTEKLKVGDVISLNFEKVASFSSGNFCDIGGLPSIKIEGKNFYESCSN